MLSLPCQVKCSTGGRDGGRRWRPGWLWAACPGLCPGPGWAEQPRPAALGNAGWQALIGGAIGSPPCSARSGGRCRTNYLALGHCTVYTACTAGGCSVCACQCGPLTHGPPTHLDRGWAGARGRLDPPGFDFTSALPVRAWPWQSWIRGRFIYRINSRAAQSPARIQQPDGALRATCRAAWLALALL